VDIEGAPKIEQPESDLAHNEGKTALHKMQLPPLPAERSDVARQLG
jgi:hypothetical protein